MRSASHRIEADFLSEEITYLLSDPTALASEWQREDIADNPERRAAYARHNGGIIRLLEGILYRQESQDAITAISRVPNCLRGDLAVLFYLAGIPAEHFRAALTLAWDHDHRQVIAAARTRQRLRAMFRRGEFPVPAHIPDQATIWRGTSYLNEARARLGYSWTVNRRVACWFAMRFEPVNGKPLVLKAIVPRPSLLYYSDSRGEQEVICFDAKEGSIDGTPDDWYGEFQLHCDRKSNASLPDRIKAKQEELRHHGQRHR